MKKNRQQTLDMIMRWEGSELNLSKSEPGGASRYGISVDFMTDYRRTLGLGPATIDMISALDEQHARDIYGIMVLDYVRFDELPSGVDYRLADITVNLGRAGGPELLQLCVSAPWPLTRIMDNATLSMTVAIDSAAVVYMLSAAWIVKKRQSPSWFPHGPDHPDSLSETGYGHGWYNRNVSACDTALSMT